MKHSDDDDSDMEFHRRAELSEQDAEALLAGHAVPGHEHLRDTVEVLRSACSAAAPPPNSELAALLLQGLEPVLPAPLPVSRRRRRWTLRLAVATVAALSGTLGGAAANALPGPIQSAVSDIVGSRTPLKLPRPDPVPGEEDTRPSGGPVPIEPSDENAQSDTSEVPTSGTEPAASPEPSARKATAPADDDEGQSSDRDAVPEEAEDDEIDEAEDDEAEDDEAQVEDDDSPDLP